MKRFAIRLFAVLGLLNLAAGDVFAETKVKLTNMHICCGGCTKGIQKAVEGLDAVKVDVDQDNEEVTITGADAAAAQKAVDAIVHAGFHATVASGDAKIPVAGVPDGKVQRLTCSNAHNCCGACTTAIKAALKSVEGVTADTCKAKQTEFVVEGNFEAKAVVAALEKAGFHVTVK